MKKTILFLIVYFKIVSAFGQLGVNTTSVHPSAILDITSTSKGFLPPRMTSAERDLITPTNSLLVYCTDCSPKGLYMYKENSWNEIALQTLDATADTKGIIQLTGNFTGSAIAPSVSNETITSDKIAQAAVTAPKIAAETGSLDNQLLLTNTTGEVRWSGIPFSYSYSVAGASNIEIRGNGDGIEDSFEIPYFTSTVSLTRGRYMYVNTGRVSQGPKTNSSDVYGNSVWIDLVTDTGYVTSYGSAQIGFQAIYNYSVAGQVFIFEVLSDNAVVKFRYKPSDSNNNQCAFKMAGTFSGKIYKITPSETLSTISNIEPTANCSLNGFSGTYIKGITLTNTNSFSVTVTNPSSYALNLYFKTTDLVLGGVSGITVSSVSPSFLVLPSGATIVVNYKLSGTPTSNGVLTGVWRNNNLTCTNTANVLLTGISFTLPQNEYVASMLFSSPFVIDEQGIIDNSTNSITMQIPYTGSTSAFSYPAFTSAPIAGSTGEGGDNNTFTYSYPAGTIVTTGGTIPITINVGEDGIYNVKKQSVVNGEQSIVSFPFELNTVNYGVINVVAVGGIRDRMYNKIDNAGNYSHQMVYFPITGPDGNKWLSNNLGANYANVNHPNFAPLQQATAQDDYNAYGSLFQWGRKPDGHEIVKWTSSYTAAITGTTSVYTANPTHALYVAISATGGIPIGPNMWGGLNLNNPCPKGYIVPPNANLEAVNTFGNLTGAFNSVLKIPSPTFRFRNTGNLASTIGGVFSYIFTGTYYDVNRFYALNLTSTQSFIDFENYASYGACVRCMKQ